MTKEEYKYLEESFEEFEKHCKRSQDTKQITFIKKFSKFFEVKIDYKSDQYTSTFFVNAIANKSLTILENDYEIITNLVHNEKLGGKSYTYKQINSKKDLMILQSKNYNLENENKFYISNGDSVIYEMQLIKKSSNGKELTYRIINEIKVTNY